MRLQQAVPGAVMCKGTRKAAGFTSFTSLGGRPRAMRRRAVDRGHPLLHRWGGKNRAQPVRLAYSSAVGSQ